jgi:hypothetical protein
MMNMSIIPVQAINKQVTDYQYFKNFKYYKIPI